MLFEHIWCFLGFFFLWIKSWAGFCILFNPLHSKFVYEPSTGDHVYYSIPIYSKGPHIPYTWHNTVLITRPRCMRTGQLVCFSRSGSISWVTFLSFFSFFLLSIVLQLINCIYYGILLWVNAMKTWSYCSI